MMKNFMLAAVVALIVVQSCNDKKADKPAPVAIDTTGKLNRIDTQETVISFPVEFQKTWARMIIRDTLGFDVKWSEDTNQFAGRKKWLKDTIYEVRYIDTLRDIAKRPLIDSATGKAKIVVRWPQLHPNLERFVTDFKMSWSQDSIESAKRARARDTTRK